MRWTMTFGVQFLQRLGDVVVCFGLVFGDRRQVKVVGCRWVRGLERISLRVQIEWRVVHAGCLPVLVGWQAGGRVLIVQIWH